MGNVLIIDDDEMMCKALSALVSRKGHAVQYALTLKHSLEKVSSEDFDVVFLDVIMPDGNGLDMLSRIKDTFSKPEVIVFTAFADPEGAEIAIRNGAWDYVEKTPSIKEMMSSLAGALQYRQEKILKRPQIPLKRERIIGKSPKMRACLDLLAQAAVTDANVLITGETGTGKELFARAIHSNSPRNDKNFSDYPNQNSGPRTKKDFVVVDCTALPETLVESVLFGHEKGAFTGADKPQDGLIKQADGGTLFLDEIGELPLAIQKAFLRVLHERHFRPVGGKKEIRSDFRLVAATHRDLDQMTETGMFRKDLLFRLRSLTIELPPLRDRLEDIKDLTRFHIGRLCNRYRMETKTLSPDFIDSLISYKWPGNVREMVNTLDGALAVAGNDPTLFSRHLPMNIRIQMARASVEKKTWLDQVGIQRPTNSARHFPKLKEFRHTLERQYLNDLMSLTNCNIQRACQISGLSRSRFYELLAERDISISKNYGG
jgi:two-component system NtrC family response regulator